MEGTLMRTDLIKYRFWYTDGSTKVKPFNSATAAEDYAYLEGDHLVRYRRLR